MYEQQHTILLGYLARDDSKAYYGVCWRGVLVRGIQGKRCKHTRTCAYGVDTLFGRGELHPWPIAQRARDYG